MSAPITGVTHIATQPSVASPAAQRTRDTDFGDALADAITRAADSERAAGAAAERFADGDPSIGLHEVMIASSRADITLRYAVTLKNKLLDAYRELMNTQV